MARWSRQILFADIDAMYASAAVLADPSLADRVIAVGSPPPRGIITSAGYAARRRGVKSAMPSARALQLCPELVIVPPDFRLYRELHVRLETAVASLLDRVEWTSIDECYADTTELQTRWEDPRALGQAVKTAVLENTGLRCTVALATNKTVAKIAADAHKPDGLHVVPPGEEASFLAGRPVSALPGIGPKTAPMLQALGITRIGDLLLAQHQHALRRQWGTRLARMQALARGIDADPVMPHRDGKSIGHETTFDRDTDDGESIVATIRRFLGDLAHDLRSDGLAAEAFTVKLKDARFRITTRQRRFPDALNYDADMWRHIQPAVRGLLAPGVRYRLAGLSLSGLVPEVGSLFDARRPQALAAMDQLIDRFGTRVVRLGGIPEKED